MIDILRTFLHLFEVIFGIVYFILKKQNIPKSYYAFINLFCVTRGYSNHFVNKLISLISPNKVKLPFRLWNTEFSNVQVKQIINELNREGFTVLEPKLPPHAVAALIKFTELNKAKLRPTDAQLERNIQLPDSVYNKNDIQAVRYDYEILQLAKEPIVQEILEQPFFVSISAAYLKTNPVLDIIQCWWHTSFGGEPDENAAQKYHFDLERFKWLKVFIYLTDVDISTGPHCFIKSSHIPGEIPFQLLKRGYARINDNDVFQFFDKSKESVITGKAGTIVLEDTRGLHKGMYVQSGARLMFQLQFSNSLFGAPLTINAKDRANMSKNLEDFSKNAFGVFDYLFKVNTEGT